jgi:hypothetical protein
MKIIKSATKKETAFTIIFIFVAEEISPPLQ